MLDEVKLSRSFRGVSFHRPFSALSTETERLGFRFNLTSEAQKPQTYLNVRLPPQKTHKNKAMFRYVHESIKAMRADFSTCHLHLRVHGHKSYKPQKTVAYILSLEPGSLVYFTQYLTSRLPVHGSFGLRFGSAEPPATKPVMGTLKIDPKKLTPLITVYTACYYMYTVYVNIHRMYHPGSIG